MNPQYSSGPAVQRSPICDGVSLGRGIQVVKFCLFPALQGSLFRGGQRRKSRTRSA